MTGGLGRVGETGGWMDGRVNGWTNGKRESGAAANDHL